MRVDWRLLFWTVVSFAALCDAQATATAGGELGNVSGQVRNRVTGEPIRKAVVALEKVGETSQSRATRSVFSDAEGRFTFDRVLPGRYTIFADRLGFLGGLRTGGNSLGRTRMLQVAPGGSIHDVAIDLIPYAVITGRVLDEDGDPIERATVVVTARWRQGDTQSTTTNDAGEFRISSLRPGKYLVRAVVMPIGHQLGRLEAAARGDATSHIDTYYPSAIARDEAAIVTAAAGQDMRGVEIRMRSIRCFRVRGRLAAPVSGASLRAVPKAGENTSVRVVDVSADGSFEASGLPPGWYEFIANGRDGRLLALTEVQVTSDLDDFVLPEAQVGTVRVSIVLDPPSDQQKKAPFQMRISRGDSRGSVGTTIRTDLEGSVRNVVAGVYRVRMIGPAGTALKSMQVDGKAVEPMRVMLSPGSEIVVTMSTRPGSIEGTITDFKAGESTSRVLVLHPDFEASGFDGESVATARVDQAGRFRVDGLPSGSYRVLAADLDWSALSDPAILEKLSSRLSKVAVKEGSAAAVAVTAVGAKEVEEIEAGH